MRKLAVVALAAALTAFSACKKTGEGEYEVKTPDIDVDVSTNRDTVRTPTVDVGTKEETLVVKRPTVDVKKPNKP